MERESELIALVSKVANEIARKGGKNFSGIGLVVGKINKIPRKYYTDLKPDGRAVDNFSLKEAKSVGELLKISDAKNELHDGFIFFDENGNLKKVAQYFAPPIHDNIAPNENYGTRYRCAQYASLLNAIKLAAVIEHDRNWFIFKKGMVVAKSDDKKHSHALH